MRRPHRGILVMGTELVVERRGKDGSIHLKEEKRNVLLINIAVNGEVVKDRSGDYRVAIIQIPIWTC